MHEYLAEDEAEIACPEALWPAHVGCLIVGIGSYEVKSDARYECVNMPQEETRDHLLNDVLLAVFVKGRELEAEVLLFACETEGHISLENTVYRNTHCGARHII
jgi:hypothetical protein